VATVSATRWRVLVHGPRAEGAGDGGLLEDVARVVDRVDIKAALHGPRLVHDAHEVGPGDLGPAAEAQHRALHPLLDQVVVESGLVLEVDLGLAARRP
jgi:hypothetical protein